MKRILFSIIAVLFSIIEMSAQVSFTPSTLTWSADDTSAKTVTVHSPGWWDTDSTSHSSHFMLSRYNGWNGYEIEISPISANTSGSIITETIPFTISGGSGTSYLNLIHGAIAHTLSVSPTSLSWANNSTIDKTLNISCSSTWTAIADADWVTLSADSGTGNGSISISPAGENILPTARTATLIVKCGNSITRTVALSQGAGDPVSGIRVAPSSLNWNSEESDMRTVTIVSQGRWKTDSTGILPGYFNISRFEGQSGTEVQIAPIGKNHTDIDIDEVIRLWDDGGNETELILSQGSLKNSFSVTPNNLTWGNTDTGWKTVSVECPAQWSATVMGNGFSLSGSTGQGAGFVRVRSTVSNLSSSPRSATLVITVGSTTRTVRLIQEGINGGYKGGAGSVAFAPGESQSDYAAGIEIPYTKNAGVSGSVMYDVPIVAAPGMIFAPPVSLSYSSLSGNGIAGYGWNIGGLSAVNVTGKTKYYDGEPAPADADSPDAVYSLDGVRLVQNSITNISNTWQYETASGHVIVRKHTDAAGLALWFEAMYPDGRRAIFGDTAATVSSVMYPLTEMRDRNGNSVRYTYADDVYTDDIHLKRIDYYQSGTTNAQASVLLEYTSRTDWHTRYFCGRITGCSVLLKAITSLNGADTLRRYDLVHETSEGIQMLTRIRCRVGGEEAVPLRFHYGDADATAAQNLSIQADGMMGRAFPEGTDLIAVRGKFMQGSYNDGVIVYPKMDSYPDDQNILVFPKIEDFVSMADNRLQTGPGFETIQAVDIDGDGTDEIVQINKKDLFFKDAFICRRYRVDSNTQLDSLQAFAIVTNSQSDGYRYFWGDFLGNGKTQLAAVQYYYSSSSNSYSTNLILIDLQNGAKLNESTLFSGNTDTLANVFSADIDGDGVSELCRLTSSGTEIWKLLSSTYNFVLKKTVTGLSSSALSNNRVMYQTDLSGDGYLDVVMHLEGAASTWGVYQYNGNSFVYSSQPMAPWTQGDEYLFMDVDRDGLPDLVQRSGTELRVYTNRNGVIGAGLVECANPLSGGCTLVPCNTVRSGASSSLIILDGFLVKRAEYEPIFPKLHLLSESAGSFGEYASYSYGYAADYSGDGIYEVLPYYQPSVQDGYIRQALPAYLVKTEQSRESAGSSTLLVDKAFTYRGSVVNRNGLGFCGFRETEILEFRGTDIYRTRKVSDPEKRGVPVSQTEYVNGVLMSQANYFFDNHTTVNSGLNPRPTGSLSYDYMHGTSESTLVSGYDIYDSPSSVSVTKVIVGTSNGSVSESVSRTFQHKVTDTLLVLGSVIEEEKTTEVHGADIETHREKVLTAYDGRMQPTTVQRYLYNGPPSSITWNNETEHHYIYDAKGNITSDRTAKYGATAYNETTYTYDAASRYMNSTTDPLGRTTTYLNYNKYGTPLMNTNWLGQNTVVSCDAWGNAVQTTYPDGTVETTTRAWSAGGEPGVLCITNTASGRPTTKAWYDALGREVCSAEQRFDGVWMRSFTEYDTRGRVSRKSLPLRDDAFGSFLWNTYEYDSYDRPVSFTEASGKQTSWSYSGTSTTTTKDGMSSTSTTDAEGNVVSVTDGGGTITYALRDDGQPSGVTVTPQGSNQGVVTTFQYDAYGRRTAIIDPSAGTRTDSYTDNADGTSSIAHTGPNGTVTTSYDRFGRVTSVTRPEFGTSYTYGTALNSSSYGKLLSETSTNGTSRLFTYDAFGRTASETECADATHWLRKVYGYGAGSNIASIAYATQDGSITTEVYSYANGHNTGISLPDGTIVYTLTEESDMGQPTEVGTGGVSRSYAFTTAGLPSRRRILDACDNTVQDFEYSYAPLTGNMNWRRDNVLGYTETFSYDALNRLLSAHQTITTADSLMSYRYDDVYMTYASNGNVTFRSNDGVLECFIDYNDGTDPYKATGNYAMGNIPDYVPEYGAIAVTSFDRPGGIMSGTGNYTTTFTYDAGGERTKMSRDEDAYGIHMDRYYLGGVYEKDDWRDGYTEAAERLFLGGSAYSAPMVLVKAASVNGGAWTPFNIGRDVQGSITEVLTADGEVVEQFRYDPWGLAMGYTDADTCAVDIAVDSLGVVVELDPWQLSGTSVYVGNHGYTGHEHLPGFGLINCNARLYDPALGRFLMPDPFIQDPASTQNFNRYSYCLNNPLKYTDENGEFITWRFSSSGIQIGVNFGGIGFGIEASWSESGCTVGVYGEVGFRIGGSGFGVDMCVQQSFGYSFQSKGVYSKTSLNASAEIGNLSVSSSVSYTDIFGDGKKGELSIDADASMKLGSFSANAKFNYTSKNSNDDNKRINNFDVKVGLGFSPEKKYAETNKKTKLSIKGLVGYTWEDGVRKIDYSLDFSYSANYSKKYEKPSHSSGIEEDHKWIEWISKENYYRKASFDLSKFYNIFGKRELNRFDNNVSKL